jgi:hypothetical protein
MMDILINGEKIQYQLEGEENLTQVIHGVESWLAGNRRIISSLSVDSRQIAMDQMKELDRHISSVARVEIHTEPAVQLAASSLETVEQYVRYLSEELLSGDPVANHDQILEGLGMISEALEKSLQVLGVNACVVLEDTEAYGSADRPSVSMQELMDELKREIQALNERYITDQAAGRIRSLLHRLTFIMPKVLRWAVLRETIASGEVPDRKFLSTALRDLAGAARSRSLLFEEIGENLQVGRDLEAFNALTSLLSFLDELVSLLSIFVPVLKPETCESGLQGKFDHIKKILARVEGAMLSSDLVTVGDLLEYELSAGYGRVVDCLEELAGDAG